MSGSGGSDRGSTIRSSRTTVLVSRMPRSEVLTATDRSQRQCLAGGIPGPSPAAATTGRRARRPREVHVRGAPGARPACRLESPSFVHRERRGRPCHHRGCATHESRSRSPSQCITRDTPKCARPTSKPAAGRLLGHDRRSPEKVVGARPPVPSSPHSLVTARTARSASSTPWARGPDPAVHRHEKVEESPRSGQENPIGM
jgi:hypothetical protein